MIRTNEQENKLFKPINSIIFVENECKVFENISRYLVIVEYHAYQACSITLHTRGSSDAKMLFAFAK